MRFSRTNMRLAAARLPDLSREIDAQAAEFSITHFCPRNPGLTKSTTYARETAKIGRSLFKSSRNDAALPLPRAALGRREAGARHPNRHSPERARQRALAGGVAGGLPPPRWP